MMRLILSNDEIEAAEALHHLAFEFDEYTPEAATAFRRTLTRHRLTDEHIRDWRRQFLAYDTVDIECGECSRELQLESRDLVEGTFECPMCHKRQGIDYTSFDPSIFDTKLLDRLRSEDEDASEAAKTASLSDGQLAELLATADLEYDAEQSARALCRLILRGACANAEVLNAIAARQAERSTRTAESSSPDTPPTEESASAPVLESLPDPNVDEMSTTGIFEALAFRRNDFTNAAIAMLEQELQARGFRLEDVTRWRAGDLHSTGAARPASFWARQITTLFLIILAIDVVVVMKSYPAVDLIHTFWPDSRLGSSEPVIIQPVLVSLVWFKAMVIVLLALEMLWWFIRSYRISKETADLKKPHRTVALGWGFMLPFVSYYTYHTAARYMLLANAVERDTTAPPVFGESRPRFSTFWEFALLTANPPLLAAWGMMTFWIVVAMADQGVMIDLNRQSWLLMVGVELIMCLGAYCFVRIVTRAQERVYESERQRGATADRLAGLGRG